VTGDQRRIADAGVGLDQALGFIIGSGRGSWLGG
jgi:hypothetical protein